MKKSIKQIVKSGAVLLALSLVFTSCEDILGKWEKPVPATVVEEAKVLGAALETGATVSITYTISGTSYVATFTKNADDTYTLVSIVEAPASTRALTRTLAISHTASLVHVDEALKFNVTDATTSKLIFGANLDINTGKISGGSAAASGTCELKDVSINGERANTYNPNTKTITITIPNGDYIYQYEPGEKWESFRGKLRVVVNTPGTASVILSGADKYVIYPYYLTPNVYYYYFTYNAEPPYEYVKESDVVGKHGNNDVTQYYTTNVAPPIDIAAYNKTGAALSAIKVSVIPGCSWDDFFSSLNGEDKYRSSVDLFYYKQDNDAANNLWLFCGDNLVKAGDIYDASKSYSFKQAKPLFTGGETLYYFDNLILTLADALKLTPGNHLDITGGYIEDSGGMRLKKNGSDVLSTDIVDPTATYTFAEP